ncbi:MAG: hypothetical protein IVW54_15950 [Candidatus Binataceae bacterium]|nr:hypothetical protein [Candidatus Binataceae bacterium]
MEVFRIDGFRSIVTPKNEYQKIGRTWTRKPRKYPAKSLVTLREKYRALALRRRSTQPSPDRAA